MFGALVDDEDYTAACVSSSRTPSRASMGGSERCASPTASVGKDKEMQEEVVESLISAQGIASHLADQSGLVLQSQQRGEAEPSREQRVQTAVQLLHHSQAQFLYRFGRWLRAQHLSYFETAAATDPLVAHYLAKTRRNLDDSKTRVQIRNRRWAAVQRLEKAAATAKSSGVPGYFTETEMKRRNPLLYQELVGKHLTDQEKHERRADFDKSDCRFTTIIFDHMDSCDERAYKKKQEEEEDDMFEEEEEDDDEQDAEVMEEDTVEELDPTQKTLLRAEFVSSMYNSFVSGKDAAFDYKSVDNNDDYDLLDVEAQDEEEKYFDEEEPCNASPLLNLPGSPVLSSPCLDRRLLIDKGGVGGNCAGSAGSGDGRVCGCSDDCNVGTIYGKDDDLGRCHDGHTIPNDEPEKLLTHDQDMDFPPVESLSVD